MINVKHYRFFSEIFKYPKEGYRDRVNECMDFLRINSPVAAEEMRRFVDFVNNESDGSIEELFSKTFHIQAICYLDIGYVLFGEDYKRGEFLVHMKQEQAKVENDCGEELPDNLANVLALLMKTDDEEFLNEMSVRILMPAIDKMLAEFDSARLELKDRILKKKHRALIQENIKDRNIYYYALRALQVVLQKDFADVTHYEPTEVKPQIGSNFLANCGTCSDIGQTQPQTTKI